MFTWQFVWIIIKVNLKKLILSISLELKMEYVVTACWHTEKDEIITIMWGGQWPEIGYACVTTKN